MSAKRKYPWGFSYARYPQPTIEELQKQAEQTLRQAGENSRKYEPVHVSGTQLCRHWWGKAWCKAIESYSDMSNRLARGRRYLKADTVLDLRLEPGEVHALVQGSRVKPYKVHITVDPLSAQFRKKIEEACAGSLHDMEALLNGDLPPAAAGLFTQEGGVFPHSSELKIRCSCPDDAILCKHAAAVLYGVGVRIDENPFLFFQLRGISVENLISRKLESRVEEMLSHAHDAPSDRTLPEEDIGKLFGV